MIDSATLVSETKTPAQAPQPNNVLKCPVLSGPPDLSAELDASIDKQTTCAQNPSHPDRTSARTSPLPASRPPSPSRCRSSVAVAWRPILRATSCLRVFVVKRENQKVPRPTPASVSQTHNVWKCPVLSGPIDLSAELDASIDKQTTCAQNLSHPDRTSVGCGLAAPSTAMGYAFARKTADT